MRPSTTFRRVCSRLPGSLLTLLMQSACTRDVPPSRTDAPVARVPFAAPTVTLITVDTVRVTSPVGSECNRPSWWVGDSLFQMVINQHPWRSRGGRDAPSAQPCEPMRFTDDDARFGWDATRKWYVHEVNSTDGPTATKMRWMESVYREPRTGTLYGLYHLEEGPYARSMLTATT